MSLTYEQLRTKTVAQLRDIAKEIDHDAVRGYTQLNKDHLLVAICKAQGIEMHEHHEIVGLNKSAIKAKIKQLKKKRDEALASHNHGELKEVRQRIHHLKRQMHRATV